MSEKYTPKKGDRVRVTRSWTGVVAGDDSFTTEQGITLVLHGQASYLESETIEKLAPPEPEWVYGAVVKPEGYVPAIYDLAAWRTPTGSIHAVDISRAWKNGTLRVLWNGDTEDE